MSLSVLIVSYNNESRLRQCLASLDEATEVVVVDNASPDGSADMVRREFPRVKLVALADNRGFSAGVNTAARNATGDVFLILNPDTVKTRLEPRVENLVGVYVPAYVDALAELKRRTALHLSVHSGMVDGPTATALKQAGVDQANVDIVGAEETWRDVIHLDDGADLLARTLDALHTAALDVVPHVVMGIHAGRIVGERRALEILRPDPPRLLVWVVLMPLPATPMADAVPPTLDEAARLLGESRLLFPDSEIALGCARPRGEYRRALERIALDAGVNRVALYSEESVAYARSLGLEVGFLQTCCSLTAARPAAAMPPDLIEIAIKGNP